MLDSNTLAEIDRDQPLRFRSVEDAMEHHAAREIVRNQCNAFKERLLKNRDYTVGLNIYSLKDAIEIIDCEQFWNYEVFETTGALPVTIEHLFAHSENENIIQDWYAAGALPQWNYVIEKAVDDLADLVFGVNYE